MADAQLRVDDAWSRECPMLSVALRTRVEAQLLPGAGPDPQPRQHRGCSPVLGLKHSVEWALPPPAASARGFVLCEADPLCCRMLYSGWSYCLCLL